MSLELLTVGRVSVDLYADAPGAGWLDDQRFVKSIGGTATNVAVAAARLGRRSAVLTKVGADPFGDYVVAKLHSFGVDTRFVGRHPTLRTPLAFAAMTPPEDPQLLFYRGAKAPDMELQPGDVDATTVADVGVLWVAGSAIGRGAGPFDDLRDPRRRAVGKPTPCSISTTGPPCGPASAKQQPSSARRSTSPRWRSAIGRSAGSPSAPRFPTKRPMRCSAEEWTIAVVKLGSDGVLVATAGDRTVVAPRPIDVVCGLGAGDAFGGAFVHGLLNGWPPARIVEYANAAGAIVAGRLMCADAMPTETEIAEMLQQREVDVSHLDDADFAALTTMRVEAPERIAKALADRPRRQHLVADGAMFIVAADHTARGMIGVPGQPRAMVDRRTMLERLLIALDNPRVDGVLASADILEDLVCLGALDGKIAVGTMNRGGLAGARWELDDRFTAYDTDHLVAANLDAGKMLLRIDPEDRGTVPTLAACAAAVGALNDRRMMAMVEPIPYTQGRQRSCRVGPRHRCAAQSRRSVCRPRRFVGVHLVEDPSDRRHRHRCRGDHPAVADPRRFSGARP